MIVKVLYAGSFECYEWPDHIRFTWTEFLVRRSNLVPVLDRYRVIDLPCATESGIPILYLRAFRLVRTDDLTVREIPEEHMRAGRSSLLDLPQYQGVSVPREVFDSLPLIDQAGMCALAYFRPNLSDPCRQCRAAAGEIPGYDSTSGTFRQDVWIEMQQEFSDDDEPEERYQSSTIRRRSAGPPLHDGSKRLCGVEWEYCSVERIRPLESALVSTQSGHHEDGSCGYEIVTRPIAGEHVATTLTLLGKALAEADATVDDTCGLHVHVDARDVRWADMRRLIALYCSVEPALYAMVGPQRIRSDYCEAVGKRYTEALENADWKGAILAVAYADRGDEPRTPAQARDYVAQWRPEKKHGGRYKGLNIIPWLYGRRNWRNPRPDTTVEFRLHECADESKKVISWAKLCVSMVDFARGSNKLEDLHVNPIRRLVDLGADRNYIKEALLQYRKDVPRNRYGYRGLRRNRTIAITPRTWDITNEAV